VKGPRTCHRRLFWFRIAERIELSCCRPGQVGLKVVHTGYSSTGQVITDAGVKPLPDAKGHMFKMIYQEAALEAKFDVFDCLVGAIRQRWCTVSMARRATPQVDTHTPYMRCVALRCRARTPHYTASRVNKVTFAAIAGYNNRLVMRKCLLL